MGCQTGFYLVVRDVEPGKVFEITKEVLKQILEYDGPVFGASAIECGHYENLSLDEAKKECRAYLKGCLRARQIWSLLIHSKRGLKI